VGVRQAGTGEVLSTFALTNENLGGAVQGLNFARVKGGLGARLWARVWGG